MPSSTLPVFFRRGLLAALLPALTGCFHAVTGPRFDPRAETALQTPAEAPRLEAALLQAPTRRFTLGPGDVLQLEILGEAGTRTETAVGPDGKIYFYLLPGLPVAGLTLGETKAKLEQELRTYLQNDPKVAVTLRRVESQHVWLLGRLGAPGIYSLGSPTTLLEAIAQAGGPGSQGEAVPDQPAGPGTVAAVPAARSYRPVAQLPDLRHSFVMREGRVLPVNFERLMQDGDPGQNIYLEAGDYIYLPAGASDEVYVLGSVSFPQPVAAPGGGALSLVAAVAGAGGTIKDAALTQVAIVRGSLAAPRIAIVDYKAIVQGKATDVRLEPGDIVYVPQSGFTVGNRYLDLVLNTFARTIGANEGARAVSRDSTIFSTTVPLLP